MSANSFATLTVPLSGAGASTSMTTFGPVKTFTVSGAFSAPVIIEASCDNATFAPVLQVKPPSGEPYFSGTSSFTTTVACSAVRVSRPYGDSVSPTVTVSAQTYNGNVFASLTVPNGVGTGAATNTATMGEIKTITVVGSPYSGQIIVEGSADSGVTYDPIAQFSGLALDGQHDVRTINGVYNSMRVRRFGISGTAGLPVVAVGGASVYDAPSYYDTITIAAVASVASATPLVVGQISFDPTVYGSPTLLLKGVAAMGTNPLTGYAVLYNLTDSETVATLTYNTTTATLATSALTVGSAAGNIKTSAKIYEGRIYVNAPATAADTINLGSLQLVVTV